jgi:hypothetical protein
MQIYPKQFDSISAVLLGIFLATLFFYPYVQTEILTLANPKEFDSTRFCRKNIDPDFKSLKVVELEKFRGRAKVYCLYEKTSKNYKIDLYSGEEGWKVEYAKSISDGFYWPIYY